MSKPVIAILGTNGFLGKPTLAAFASPEFQKNFSLPIRILTTKSIDPLKDNDSFKYYKVGDTASSYKEALSGADVLINIGAFGAYLSTLLEAVKASKLKLYIPSQFGTDLLASAKVLPQFISTKQEHSEAARAVGFKVVDVYTGLFFVPGAFLTEWIGSAGHNPADNLVTYIGDENTKFSVSDLGDIGKSLAAIASKDPKSLPDQVRIYSDVASQKEVVELYEKKHDVKLKVLPSIALDKATADAKKFPGEPSQEQFIFSLQVLSAAGDGKGLYFKSNNQRELVNPKESLFKWTKYE